MVSSVVALLGVPAMADEPGGGSPVILQRFLALDDPTPKQFRALRHLEARNDKFEKSAWMDVWTEGDVSGFRFVIIGEGGSSTSVQRSSGRRSKQNRRCGRRASRTRPP